jgi:tetratricopeptide (TPR) repeat protein
MLPPGAVSRAPSIDWLFWAVARRSATGAVAPPRAGTISGGEPEEAGVSTVSQSGDLERATELWREAYRHQMQGDLDRAIELYRQSITVCPTGEAHTFLGWTLSFRGRLDEATAECLRAIEVDPDFGNPYNDIGVYLMQQEKLDEAVRWLEKAKQARRYEPRHFPFLNLGRIYLRQGRVWEALREFEGAVRMAPTDIQSHRALHSLRARLN